MIHLPSVRTIGLTGGIACGKSMVAEYLAGQHHCPILDADIYSRDAVTPPSPILDTIQVRYGRSILHDNGELNRAGLGQIVFSDPTEREWLEGKIHPYVRQRLIQESRSLGEHSQERSPIVMVIPLLFESQMESLVTEIWVVACSHEQQCQRLMARNGFTRAQAEDRIASQWPLAEKIKRATVVIDNSGDRAQTYQQVDRAIALYPSSSGS